MTTPRNDENRGNRRLATVVAATLVLALGCARTPDEPPGRNDGTRAAAAPTAAVAAQRPTDVAAVVDGRSITVGDVDTRIAADAELRDDVAGGSPDVVYAARREMLEEMIDEILLDEEAHRHGVSRAALEARLTAAVTVPDEEFDRAYESAKAYDGADPILARRTKRLLAGSETEARARIRDAVIRDRKHMAIRRFTLALRKQAHIELKLAKPAKPSAG